jgi:hypothetical protein
MGLPALTTTLNTAAAAEQEYAIRGLKPNAAWVTAVANGTRSLAELKKALQNTPALLGTAPGFYTVVTHPSGWIYYRDGVRLSDAEVKAVGAGAFLQVSPETAAAPPALLGKAPGFYTVVTHPSGWIYYRDGVRLSEAEVKAVGAGAFLQVSPEAVSGPGVVAPPASTFPSITTMPVTGCAGCSKTGLQGLTKGKPDVVAMKVTASGGSVTTRSLLDDLSPGVKNTMLIAGAGGLFFLYLRSAHMI